MEHPVCTVYGYTLRTSSLSSKALLSSSDVDWCRFECTWVGGVGLGAALILPLPGGEANCKGPGT